MKIADITYQSNMSEFIDMGQVSSQVEVLGTLISNIKDSLLSSLYNCTTIENGGLDKESFILESESILNEKANESKENVEMLLENATEHRIEELTRYIQCLEERISEVEEKIQTLNAMLRETQSGTELPTISAKYIILMEQIKSYERELGVGTTFMLGLRQKLEMAKRELSKLNI